MVIAAGLLFSSLVMESPWSRRATRTAPWGLRTEGASEARAEARSDFFQSLHAVEESGEPPRLPESFYREETGSETATDSRSGLQDLPWSRFVSRHRDESFQKSFLWPVSGGRLSSGFGLRNGSVHEGLDIAKGSGVDIRAAAKGVVVFNGTIRGYGRTLVIYHGDGISTVYAHNRENLRPLGSRVKMGEVIARMGRSGEATGYHVHFEVRKNGRPINPLSYPLKESPMQPRRT